MKVFAAIALLAVSNGALINLIMASRVVYGMGDQSVLPTVFARVHSGRQTPWVAILFTAVIAMMLLLTVGRHPDALDTLASTTVVLLLLAFIMVNISVLVLRSDPVEHEHFRTPTIFPIPGHPRLARAAGLPGRQRHNRLRSRRAVAGARARPLRGERARQEEPGPKLSAGQRVALPQAA